MDAYKTQENTVYARCTNCALSGEDRVYWVKIKEENMQTLKKNTP